LEERTLEIPARLFLRKYWPARSHFSPGVRSFSWPLRYYWKPSDVNLQLLTGEVNVAIASLPSLVILLTREDRKTLYL